MPPDTGRAIVLADGAVPPRGELDAAWPGWDEGCSIIVAADGGARHAGAYDLRIDHWIGDGDSIEPTVLEAVRAHGARIERLAEAKDETDTEMALVAAVAAGSSSIVVLGALGGPRIDHALANVGLLAHPVLEGRVAWLFDERCARLSLVDAEAGAAARTVTGRTGDVVTLLPIGESVEGVTTEGLRFPLVGEPLLLGQTRGVSNVRTGPTATVTVQRGRLLVIEIPVTVGS